ncbi:hypothetical protein CONLIGDRAFT_654659 [Coniochaeta ligniaria NRRL 30616]|uniref:Galactose oxidase n=1 Tax=Coniochaeta ligniaria NRRL 30616 TaxID=1408157 RepID=A0A1J7JGI0_9PEZI|nr:hypothetical protein CONLIGDRAFT_654659 [Coniochaeta ligniaria NRRL 30616]
MFDARLACLSVLAGWAASASAQATWSSDQVNTTMCYWEQVRAAVVRDTVYLDGGILWWLPGLADGSYATPVSDNNPLGIIYTLNFSKPFNTTQNITAIMGQLSKAPGGGAANNAAPNYLDGAMLANDGEFFLYGGMLRNTAAFVPPHPDDITSYQAYQYGIQKDGFLPGFVTDRLPSGMTRYLAYGGAANAPSENKAWYFSGMRSPSWGEIFRPSSNQSLTASNVSNTFITLDMSTQQQETWNNVTLPDSVTARANPELVWVPVGAQGLLVALGGVVFPEFTTSSHVSRNEAVSEAESPAFMTNIDVYDVAGDEWYQQPTSGGPGQLTRGCTVVAPAQDGSSFNIYYYGGYDGLHVTGDFSDAVWVLSLPSFTWTKVAAGKTSHGRAGHKCFMPYPDQMIVIGGYASLSGATPKCVFNLSSATWMTGYDPAKWSNYTVPDAVVKAIGGTATGGATATSPSTSGWADAPLAKVFETQYPSTKIKKWYPYAVANTTDNTNPNFTPTPQSNSGGLPKYLPPLLGTIFGLMFITLLATGIFLYRRRKLLRRGGSVTELGTEDSNGNRIMSWIRGQPIENKAPTVTTEETPTSPEMESPPVLYHPAAAMAQVHHEMADTQLAELPDTSPRAELQDTGLTPVEIINRHSHLGRGSSHLGSLNDPSNYSSITQTDHASTVSRSSHTPNNNPSRQDVLLPLPSPPDASPDLERPDSPPLGAAGNYFVSAPGGGKVASGVSEVSERDRAHLRQISDATVSSGCGGWERGWERECDWEWCYGDESVEEECVSGE